MTAMQVVPQLAASGDRNGLRRLVRNQKRRLAGHDALREEGETTCFIGDCRINFSGCLELHALLLEWQSISSFGDSFDSGRGADRFLRESVGSKNPISPHGDDEALVRPGM